MDLVQHDWIVGLQDLGAAGLTSSAIECASKAGTGLRIDVLKVPRREADMTPYEVMLSESQERMLVIAKRGYEEQVRELFARWELRSDVIGEVTDDGMARITEGDREVACVPVRELTSPPQYRRAVVEPAWLRPLQEADLASLPDLAGAPAAEAALLRLLRGGNGACKRWIYRQYDHQVMTNTVVAPGAADAAVLRIRGTRRGIALATDGNGRYCCLDPYAGGAIAVAEVMSSPVFTVPATRLGGEALSAEIHSRARDGFRTYLGGINQALAPDREFIVGHTITLADICFVAELSLFHNEKARAGELLKRGVEPILNAAVEADFPHAMSHFTRLSKHPACAPDVEPYLAKIEKVASR